MTNKKSTKKALLMSALSLLLCCSMLIGTTFAWFTDAVESGINKITAGNLDVEVYYGKEAEPETNKVTGATKIFTDAEGKDILWEPGAVAYTNLNVVNEGSLELKYQFAMNFENENYITENLAKLSQVLKVAFLDEAVSGTREQILAAAKAAGGVNLKNLMKAGTLAAGKNQVYGVVIYWEPSDLDNTWNVFNGRTTSDGQPLHIDLGLKLVATQKDAEQDSFGSDYDEYAGLPWDGETVTAPVADANGVIHITNAAELVWMMNGTGNSFYTGKTIVLDADIDLNGHTVKGIGSDSAGFGSTFDGQGYKISNFKIDASDRTYYAGLFNQVGGNGTIKNLTVKNATIIGKGMVGAVASSVDGGGAMIDNCKAIDCTLIGVKKVGAVVGYAAGSTVTNNYAENCTVYYSEKEGAEILGYENTGSTVSNNTFEDVTVKQATVILTAEDLLALSGTKINGTCVLLCDIDMFGKEMKPIQLTDGSANKLTFEGNGHTISNLTLVQDYQNGMYVSALFNIMHSGAELNVNDLTLTNVTSTSAKYAAAVVAYNSTTLTINLNNVDVDKATVSAETVAALVSYSTGAVNLTDCDVSNITLSGKEAENKVGAYIGTANQASCAVTVTNCTNNSTYRDYGRVINGATWNGGVPVATTEQLIAAIKAAPVGQETVIVLADGTYAGDINITLAALGAQSGDVVIKAAGDNAVITGTVTMGLYENRTSNVAHWGATVTFEGITFDHAEAAKHSLDVQSLNGLHLKNCTIIGDGEYGIDSSSGNNTGASTIIGCTFVNAAIQGYGNFCSGLVIDQCTFNNSCVNIGAGNGVTVQNCTFSCTLTDANNNDSFYVIRTSSTGTPITVKNCGINVDSTVNGTAAPKAGKAFAIFHNRHASKAWTIENVEVTLTEAALAQPELKVIVTAGGAMNTTNLTVNGVLQ